MKRVVRWFLGIVLAVVLMIVLLVALLYVPPIQRWIVDKATLIASEETGMDVHIGGISLSFPLDLAANDVVITAATTDTTGAIGVIPQRDTIALVERLTADIELMPLLGGEVMINTFEFEGVEMNTGSLIAAAEIKGRIERFALRSRGVDLGRETVTLNNARLSGADIDVRLLGDTTAVDTTASEAKWKVVANDIALERLNLALHTIGDSTSVRTRIGRVQVSGGNIDLETSTYAVDAISLSDAAVSYDNNWADTIGGLDPNHIALDSINIIVDSIFYNAPRASLLLRQLSMREKSGLEIVQMECDATMDATTLHIPELKLLTPYSDLEALAKVDLNVMDEHNPGQLYLRLYASVGKGDVMRFLGGMPQTFRTAYPTSPMTLRGAVSGNMKHVDISGLSLELPTALKLDVKGTADNLTDMERLKADIDIAGITENLDFVEALIDTSGSGTISIPYNISLDGNLKADGQNYNADLVMIQDSGRVTLSAAYKGEVEGYNAELRVDSLNLNNFLPKDSLRLFSAYIKADGEGFDVFSPNTRLTAEGRITDFQFGSWNINNVNLTANIDNGRLNTALEAHNKLANGTINLDALLSHDEVDATFAADLRKADFYTLNITEKPLTLGMCAHIDMESDLGETHKLEGYINDLTIITEKQTYRPKDVSVDMFTNPDTIRAKMNTGDFTFILRTSGGYMKVLESVDSIMAEMARQRENRIIDQLALQHRLPLVNVRMASGSDNPIANYLRYNGMMFDDMKLALNTSPVDGITGRSFIHSFLTDSMQLDTIRLNIENDSLNYIRLHADVINRRGNPHIVFRSSADAYLFEKNLGIDVKYFDAENKQGILVGAHAEMRDSGIHVHFTPDKPTLGYIDFNLNKDNFILLGRDKKVRAGIDLITDEGTGIQLYSTDEENPDMLQDLTLTLHKVDIGKLLSTFPYMPSVSGILNGDFRVMQDKGNNLSMVSYLAIDKLIYEKNPMGDISSEFTYFLRDDGTHMVDATLNQNEREIGLLSGSYKSEGEGWLDAVLTLSKFPLNMANGFVPDNLLGLEGYAEGNLAVRGKVGSPMVDGELQLDSTYVVSVPYGLSMRADNKPVRFDRSRLYIENYNIYSSNNQPLTINGSLDFSNLDRMGIALRMRAKDYLLINSKRQKGSIAYGKAYVNFFANVNGRFDDLRMRGRLDVLGKTDLTYILKDSPLSTDDQLKELVTFTDFRDTTRITVKRPPIGGLDMSLKMNVENGARMMCALNTQQTNYVSIEGGGELNMLYTAVDGLQLFGRYTVNDGEMKYALPVIPLKTFKLQKGSYVEFTGEVMNPTLNLTATEEMSSQVTASDGSTRNVLFDCGVNITQTLNNLGLEFILDAPDDMTIKNELATLSTAQKSKLAVTMLTTGMYLNEGSGGNFSMNNALSSFLQNEINSITNNAIKSIDINLGMDQQTDASGQTSTDYSFKFAKRFWNNRFSIMVGGKVSSGSSSAMSSTQNDDSFINNVSLEYRLDDTAQRNVRLFYNKEANDLFADKVSEYGAGFVWRKKMNSLSELFKSSKTTNRMMQRNIQRTSGMRRDSTSMRRDSTSMRLDSAAVRRDSVVIERPAATSSPSDTLRTAAKTTNIEARKE